MRKRYTVWVYYWSATKDEKELWFGYTCPQGSGESFVGEYLVDATTRAKAIIKAINIAKAKKDIWQEFEEILSEQELSDLSNDLSLEHDHYIYGTPKKYSKD